MHPEVLETTSGSQFLVFSSYFVIQELNSVIRPSRQALLTAEPYCCTLPFFETGPFYEFHIAPELRILLASVYQVLELWVNITILGWS